MDPKLLQWNMLFRNDISMYASRLSRPHSALSWIQSWARQSKKCTIPNQMPEASAVMNSTKALYNPSLVSKGGKEIGKNILYKPIDCASQWSLVGLTCLRKSMFPFFVKVETTPTRHLSWAAESVAKPKMTTWAHSNTGQMVTTEWRRRKEENVLGHKYT